MFWGVGLFFFVNKMLDALVIIPIWLLLLSMNIESYSTFYFSYSAMAIYDFIKLIYFLNQNNPGVTTQVTTSTILRYCGSKNPLGFEILTCEITTCGNGTAAKIKHQDIINDMPCYTSLHPPPPLLFINNIILFSFFRIQYSI